MGTFGEKLQREREMRGITLEEIAEATKIGTRSLRALEEQDFDKLPGGIFNKGFVRAYSKYLGIDEDQAVADYVVAFSEAQATGKLKVPDTVTEGAAEEESDREPVRIPWGLLITVALVVAVGLAAKSYYSKHGFAKLKRQATPMKEATVAPTAPQTVPATTPAAEPKQPAPAAQQAPTLPAKATAASTVPGQTTPETKIAEGFVVKVRAKEDAWIQVSADGKQVLSELLKANSDRSVRAAKEVVLVTGNAGGVEVSRNDQVLPPLGEGAVKRTVTITAQDVKQ